MTTEREKFLAALEDSDREALAKVFDRAVSSRKSGRTTFTPFLSEREYAEFLKRKKHIGDVSCSAFGGYEDAARVMLCFGEEASFPICAIRITGRGIETLRHGDYLGAVLSLGIERARVGDIVLREEDTIAFLDVSVASFVAESLREVGGSYVACEILETDDVKVERRFEEITGTVAALRADSVLSVMLNTSRTKAVDYISAQRFYLNQVLCTKCDKEIKENDILTVRGFGKAYLEGISGRSKKGRLFITLKKYI